MIKYQQDLVNTMLMKHCFKKTRVKLFIENHIKNIIVKNKRTNLLVTNIITYIQKINNQRARVSARLIKI